MPRTYKNRDVHTKPEMAGEHNIPDGYIEKRKADDGGELMGTLAEMFAMSCEKRKRKSAWTVELLQEEIHKFFKYCSEKELKPSKSSLKLWLGISSTQYNDWENNKNYKYGDISEIIKDANFAIESQYINRAEKYPTANIFLMKSSHGHIESSKLDITTNGNDLAVDLGELKDKIAKMGLDKNE